VAKAYGVFNEALGCANRGTFIIDKDGKVVDSFATENLATPRDASSYQAALDKL
jgi:alkyl hydroperoxide reductase subunit AhpC